MSGTTTSTHLRAAQAKNTQSVSTNVVQEDLSCHLCNKVIAVGLECSSRSYILLMCVDTFLVIFFSILISDQISLTSAPIFRTISQFKPICLTRQVFSDKTKLWKHIRLHNRPKNHVCTTCGEGFYEKYQLTEHSYVHTGVKPYKVRSMSNLILDRGCWGNMGHLG